MTNRSNYSVGDDVYIVDSRYSRIIRATIERIDGDFFSWDEDESVVAYELVDRMGAACQRVSAEVCGCAQDAYDYGMAELKRKEESSEYSAALCDKQRGKLLKSLGNSLASKKLLKRLRFR